MEKAILKTLIYADIFDYPMKAYEIHKWLIGRKVTLRQVEKALGRLAQSGKCKVQSEYYFLPKQAGLVGKRKRRQRQSVKYLRKARLLTSILKVVPWIKLVGISGGLAMENADKTDDIDLFIITSKNRLWICRLLILGILSLLGQRRKVGDFGRKIAGKLCLNILLEEDRLVQNNKDIYLAHEVLQMKVLWQKGWIYSKYLTDNAWAFKFLPNWTSTKGGKSITGTTGRKSRDTRGTRSPRDTFISGLELLAKKFQLWYMKSPRGMERIQDGAVYFHPNDIRPTVLASYKQKLKTISNP